MKLYRIPFFTLFILFCFTSVGSSFGATKWPFDVQETIQLKTLLKDGVSTKLVAFKVDASGNIIGKSSARDHTLQIFNSSGRLLKNIDLHQAIPSPDEFEVLPSMFAFTVDGSDQIVVLAAWKRRSAEAESGVIMFDKTGNFQRMVTLPGMRVFSHITIDQNSIYVLAANKHNEQISVLKLDNSGKIVQKYPWISKDAPALDFYQITGKEVLSVKGGNIYFTYHNDDGLNMLRQNAKGKVYHNILMNGDASNIIHPEVVRVIDGVISVSHLQSGHVIVQGAHSEYVPIDSIKGLQLNKTIANDTVAAQCRSYINIYDQSGRPVHLNIATDSMGIGALAASDNQDSLYFVKGDPETSEYIVTKAVFRD